MLQDNILTILERNRGKIITGGAIASRLDVSRTAVWKAVAALREQGNEIESIQSSGYRLSEDSDGLNRRIIHDYLDTAALGRSMEIAETVSSTFHRMAQSNPHELPEGHTVLAHHQTHGKGRLGRPFYSPKNSGVYMSVLLKPAIELTETPFLTICAAVAVTRAIEEVCGLETGVKWVNDVYHNGKKLCGILTEASVSAEMQTVDYAVVGIGINTAATPPEVQDIATSICEATGKRGVRNRLAAGVLNHLERVYLDFTRHGKKREILKAYRERLFIIGRQVEVFEHGQNYTATVEGIDNSARLMVKRENGQTAYIGAGEIKLC